jgi:DNA-binding transcriptional LysR family regulator
VRLELVTGTTGALIAKVMTREVEAAFVAEPFAADGLEGEPVFREELVLITPKGFRKIRTSRDIGRTTLIAFAAGCSYRRRLEAWLGGAQVVPDRVLEFGSYHAIVACVAAGAGIAIVPRSVIRVSLAASGVGTHSLPDSVATARTFLVWRQGHRSIALDAMRGVIRRMTRGARRAPTDSLIRRSL